MFDDVGRRELFLFFLFLSTTDASYDNVIAPLTASFLLFRLAKLSTSQTAEFLAISLSLFRSLLQCLLAYLRLVSCDRSAGYMYLG